MSEHYYGNVGAGNEPEVCCAVKDNRTNLPFCSGRSHQCYEPPDHKGSHKCGRHHDGDDLVVQCRYEWENEPK